MGGCLCVADGNAACEGCTAAFCGFEVALNRREGGGVEIGPPRSMVVVKVSNFRKQNVERLKLFFCFSD